jgi:predicted glycoside hydrolase/deacetylase ChbG (UPF0249 family)
MDGCMNNPNPLLRKLGFADTDRVAIIHADDVGMCQASAQAFAELDAFGLVTCGAVMVPCPWFPQVADYARQHPQVDLGLHLTLTSEWRTYRWGPVSTRDPASGLLDSEGFFPHRSAEVQQSADPAAAAQELRAQLQRARDFGIRLTHIDTHMGAVVHPKFLQTYIGMAVENRLPLMVLRMDEHALRGMGLDEPTAQLGAQIIRQLEESGFPLLDVIYQMPLDKPDNRLDIAKAAFDALQPGITHFVIHPSVDTPELRAITPDWRGRVADYQTFLRDDLRAYLKQTGVQVIGYRHILALLQPEVK